MHGRTTSILGTITPHTASEAHGTGAVTTIHGMAMHGIGTHGLILLGATTDGMIHGTTVASMIHGTTVAITDICTRTTMDGTADGIHIIGAHTIIIITQQFLSGTKTAGMENAGRPAQTEYSQAGYLHEAA